MEITKADLKDWNSHPVTKVILSQVKKQLVELASESTLRSTVDETAMETAKQQGIIEGANSLLEAYEILSEDTE